MAITLNVAGSWQGFSSGPIQPNIPTHAVGDMLICRVAYKSSAIATCDASTSSTGWAKVGEFHNGTTNSGNGTGSVAVAAFWKIATSTGSSDSITVNFSQAITQAGAVWMVYQKGAGETWDTPVGDGGGDTTAGTSHSATIQSHVSVTAGDLVDFFTAICDDTTMTVPTFTQTGATLDAVTESPAAALADTTGADGAYDGGYRTVTSGTSSAAAVVTGTTSTSETGSSWTTRLRVTSGESHSGSFTLTGGGVATAGASTQRNRSGNLVGGGVVTGPAETARNLSQTFTGGGSTPTTFSGAHNASPALTGGGIVNWAYSTGAPEEHDGSFTLTGGGTLITAAAGQREGTVSLTGGGLVTVGGSGGRTVSVVLTGGGIVSFVSGDDVQVGGGAPESRGVPTVPSAIAVGGPPTGTANRA